MSDCISNIHEDPVEATVHGTFHNAYNPANDSPVAYCVRCAQAIEMVGFFTPSTADPEGRALVQAIHDRKAGS